MSIHEQRIVLRILEHCQKEALQGVRLKEYTGAGAPKFEHGLFDVDVTMHASDVIVSDMTHKKIVDTLDSLSGRFFTYEDENLWWKCGFIQSPEYQKRTGIIKFRVDNKLWDVLTSFAHGYREFEINKALALPNGYAIRFYMLMTNQKTFKADGSRNMITMTVEQLKEWLGIPADAYKTKDGKDRIDNLEDRVIKPAKAALDASCPWTFDYIKMRENNRYIRSRVTGFKFIPCPQPKFRDHDLEKKELQAHVSVGWSLSDDVRRYLQQSMGFTNQELGFHKELLSTAARVVPDLVGELAIIRGRMRDKDNPKGYAIAALKGVVEDYQKSAAEKVEPEVKPSETPTDAAPSQMAADSNNLANEFKIADIAALLADKFKA